MVTARISPGGRLLKGAVLIAILLAGGWLIARTGFGLDAAWIDHAVRDRGLEGGLTFLALAMALVALGLPRQVAAFAGGYAFDVGGGVAWTLCALIGACVADFACARLLGRRWVQARFGQRLARLDAFLRDNTFTAALLIRLVPAGSNFVTSLLAGVSSVRPLPFFAGSALGYVPQTVIFALLGSGVHVDPALRISLSVLLLVASTLLGLHLYRRLRQPVTQGL